MSVMNALVYSLVSFQATAELGDPPELRQSSEYRDAQAARLLGQSTGEKKAAMRELQQPQRVPLTLELNSNQCMSLRRLSRQKKPLERIRWSNPWSTQRAGNLLYACQPEQKDFLTHMELWRAFRRVLPQQQGQISSRLKAVLPPPNI